ncbi:Uncharacterised protein [Yersinia enterocolitica]|nr:Uncharacterised protein [Yersinia enterocolitica]
MAALNQETLIVIGINLQMVETLDFTCNLSYILPGNGWLDAIQLADAL